MSARVFALLAASALGAASGRALAADAAPCLTDLGAAIGRWAWEEAVTEARARLADPACADAAADLHYSLAHALEQMVLHEGRAELACAAAAHFGQAHADAVDPDVRASAEARSRAAIGRCLDGSPGLLARPAPAPADPPVSSAPSATEPAAPAGARTAQTVLAGVTAALLVGSGVTFALAHDADADLDAARLGYDSASLEEQRRRFARYDDARARTNAYGLTSIALLGTGVATAATLAWMWWVDD